MRHFHVFQACVARGVTSSSSDTVRILFLCANENAPREASILSNESVDNVVTSWWRLTKVVQSPSGVGFGTAPTVFELLLLGSLYLRGTRQSDHTRDKCQAYRKRPSLLRMHRRRQHEWRHHIPRNHPC